MDRVARLRRFFANYITVLAAVTDPRIEAAFAAVPRAPFAGPGPWSIAIPGRGYVRTPDDDPAFLYQDTLVALDAARGINIGEPHAHAAWLEALGLRGGETVLQVGAGSGYYTAILAELAGPAGHVVAYEIDPALAQRARDNLGPWPQVELRARSGIADDLPKSDAIYVCAALTQPSWAWLDALLPGGRLIFPLHGERSMGGMLRLTRPDYPPTRHRPIWPARFITQAGFIPCTGPQQPQTGRRLAAAFRAGGWQDVRSFRLDAPDTATCWFAGDDWWLSTRDPEEG